MIEFATPLGKAAASAAGKVVASVASTQWNRSRLRNALEELERTTDVYPTQRIKLTVRQAHSFEHFLSSNDLLRIERHILAAQFYGDSQEILESLRAELKETVRLELALEHGVIDELSNQMFDYLLAVNGKYILETQLSNLIPKDAVANILPTVRAQIDAGTRNSSVLTQIHLLSNFHNFYLAYCKQLTVVHENILVPHSTHSTPVLYESIYVEPSFRERTTTVDVDRQLSDHARVVVTGDPGGGKSTFSTKQALDLADRYSRDVEGGRIPFIVVLRDFANELKRRRVTVVQFIESLCKIPYNLDAPSGAVEYALLNDRAYVIFDGIDELIDISMRDTVVKSIDSFSNLYPDAQILATSRRIGYERVPLNARLFHRLELGPLTPSGVQEYVTKWFSLDTTRPPERNSRRALSFLRESESVPDLRSNPLMLALMCNIYAAEGYLPRNRSGVYEKCAHLLFEKWDAEREIIIKLPFEQHIRPVLYSLAYWLYQEKTDPNGVLSPEIQNFIANFLHKKRFPDFDDAYEAAGQFLAFCTGRAWVLSDVGSDPEKPRYAFTHRTFLEYFAARQMTRLNPLPDALFENLQPSIAAAEKDVVAQVAVQLISDNVEDGADEFALSALAYLEQRAWGAAYRNTLSFLCRLLSAKTLAPSITRKITRLAFSHYAATVPVGPPNRQDLLTPLFEALCASAENLPSVRDGFLTSATDYLGGPKRPGRALLAVIAYPDASAAFNVGMSQEFHWTVWREIAPTLQHEIVRALKPRSSDPTWLKLLFVGHGISLAEQSVAPAVSTIFDENCADATLMEPFARSLLTLLVGEGSPARADVTVQMDLGEDACSSIVMAILRMKQPFASVTKSETRKAETLSLFRLPSPLKASRPHWNSLYLLLVMFVLDTEIEVGAASRGDLKVLLAEATGIKYSRSELARLPINSVTRNFFERWVGGARSLVALKS